MSSSNIGGELMSLALRLVFALCLAVATISSAAATTFQTIYNFTGGSDGANPNGLVFFKNAFYGTTLDGGFGNGGTIFRIDAKTHTRTTLFEFCSAITATCQGAHPRAGVTFDKAGALYGTTSS